MSQVLPSELAEWIGAQGMSHARGAPCHPQTQGKIEAFIEHYNHRRTLHSPGHG
jgi:putative transposase